MSGSDDHECRFIDQHLEQLKSAPKGLDHDSVSDHILVCSSCYARTAEFFRLMDVPDSGYIRETVDDLSQAIYNLVKALIKERPQEGQEDNCENVRFIQDPDQASHYVQEGSEMIEDVQDYTGRDDYRGESMDGLRDLIEESSREFRLGISLLQKAVDMGARWSPDCLNLQGILYLSEDQYDKAEPCFRAVIAKKQPDLYLRTVQVHAMNNLSYILSLRGDHNEAIKFAQRASVYAEEIGMDPFSSYFGLMYFYLNRDQAGDNLEATQAIEKILKHQTGEAELKRCLNLKSNKEIRELLEKQGFRDSYASIF